MDRERWEEVERENALHDIVLSLLLVQANLGENSSNNGYDWSDDKQEQSEMPISDKRHNKTNKEGSNPLNEKRKFFPNAVKDLVNITETAKEIRKNKGVKMYRNPHEKEGCIRN